MLLLLQLTMLLLVLPASLMVGQVTCLTFLLAGPPPAPHLLYTIPSFPIFYPHLYTAPGPPTDVIRPDGLQVLFSVVVVGFMPSDGGAR